MKPFSEMSSFEKGKVIGIGGAVAFLLLMLVLWIARPQPFKMSPMGSSGIVISAQQLEDILTREGYTIMSVNVGDASYELPKESWFVGRFLFDYRRFIAVAGKTFYQPAANDCDKFTLFFHACGNLVPRSRKTGVAIGELWRTKPAHAVGVGVCIGDDGKTNVVYIEPQVPARVNLTADEKSSVIFAGF
jgi:hypothetical protein